MMVNGQGVREVSPELQGLGLVYKINVPLLADVESDFIIGNAKLRLMLILTSMEASRVTRYPSMTCNDSSRKVQSVFNFSDISLLGFNLLSFVGRR